MSTTTTPPTRSAFFYGTLMAPQVLHRVCHGPSSPTSTPPTNFKTHPALLPRHRRQRVKNADYPAILPHPTASVRGTYVSGLSNSDILRLDIFEGSEYSREKVKVKLLAAVGDESGEGNIEGEEVEAESYIWKAPPSDLEDAEWDFAEFQREKMRFWVRSEGEGEYAEVDEAVAAMASESDGTRGRGANGHITNALNEETKKSAV